MILDVKLKQSVIVETNASARILNARIQTAGRKKVVVDRRKNVAKAIKKKKKAVVRLGKKNAGNNQKKKIKIISHLKKKRKNLSENLK